MFDASQRSDLLDLQSKICDLLLSIDPYQDWKPSDDAWTFRQIAAHMAKVERECHINRIDTLRRANNPTFSYYYNTVEELGDADMSDSITKWRENRRQLIERLQQLRPADEKRIGQHDVFGEINPFSVARIALDHDTQHLNHLQKMVTQFNESDY